jgi:hypothetical protein
VCTDVLRERRGDRLRQLGPLLHPPDVHRVLPVLDSALTTAMPVHPEVVARRVSAVVPPGHTPPVRNVFRLRHERVALKDAMPNHPQPEHLSAQRDVVMQRCGGNILNHIRQPGALDQRSRDTDQIGVLIPHMRSGALTQRRVPLARR